MSFWKLIKKVLVAIGSPVVKVIEAVFKIEWKYLIGSAIDTLFELAVLNIPIPP